jgi:hypothetical protein
MYPRHKPGSSLRMSPLLKPSNIPRRSSRTTPAQHPNTSRRRSRQSKSIRRGPLWRQTYPPGSLSMLLRWRSNTGLSRSSCRSHHQLRRKYRPHKCCRRPHWLPSTGRQRTAPSQRRLSKPNPQDSLCSLCYQLSKYNNLRGRMRTQCWHLSSMHLSGSCPQRRLSKWQYCCPPCSSFRRGRLCTPRAVAPSGAGRA